MPFKSEKQRRFLWAEHPDIAKRWAHEYPNQKKLPMYAHDKKPTSSDTKSEESKAASINISQLVNRYVNNRSISSINSVQDIITKTDKTADSKQERVDIPHSSEPVYAGEEREKGKITSDIPGAMNISGTDNGDVKKPQNAINELLTKLSVVLSPHIEQTIENMRAEREGRVAVRIPRNRGIKRYPCATPSIPLPMGMAQAQQPQPQQQPQTPAQPARPVGGGSHPQFNPINAFGAISMSGEINGNAAFGAKNSPDSSKLSCVIKRANEPIDFDQWHGKAFKIVSTPEGKAVKSHTDGTPIANEPGQVSIVTPENGDAWNWPDAPAETVNNFKKNWGSIQGGIAGYKMDQIRRGMQKQPTAPQPPAPSVPQPPKPPVPAPNTGAMTSQPIPVKRASRSEILGKIMSIEASDEDMAYWEEEYCDELAGYQKAAKDNKTTPCSCGCGDTISTCKCPKSCSCKQPGGSCYKPTKEKDADMVKYSLDDMLKSARCWAGYEPVPGKAPYSEDSCRPVGSGKKKKKENKKSEKKADDADNKSERDDENKDTAGKAEKSTRGPALLAAGLTGAAGGLAGFGASKYLDSKGYSLSKLLQKKSAAPFQNALLDAQVPAYKERVARAAALMGKLMGKGKNTPAPSGSSVVKAGASSPAWQRSEGKNDEGGLNEKGRKSYEREHGGNLKAPVTQKNPKGEAKKRQNSFCSRMCGMKRVNTGASTAKDPDSRINKSLRKWNCKCSSAMTFGALLANCEPAN